MSEVKLTEAPSPFRKGPPRYKLKIHRKEQLPAYGRSMITRVGHCAFHGVPFYCRALFYCEEAATLWKEAWERRGFDAEFSIRADGKIWQVITKCAADKLKEIATELKWPIINGKEHKKVEYCIDKLFPRQGLPLSTHPDRRN